MKTLSRNIAYLGKSTDETEADKARRPEWKCFCCHDSGFVANHLVKKVIPEYNMKVDRMPICNRIGCDKFIGQTLSESDMLDDRFTSDMCQELHDFNLNQWVIWEQETAEVLKQRQDKVKEAVEAIG